MSTNRITKPDVKIEAIASLSRSLDNCLLVDGLGCMSEGCKEPGAGIISLIVASFDGSTACATMELCAAHLAEHRQQLGTLARSVVQR